MDAVRLGINNCAVDTFVVDDNDAMDGGRSVVFVSDSSDLLLRKKEVK